MKQRLLAGLLAVVLVLGLAPAALAAVLQCSIDALYGPEPPGGGNGAAS